MIYFDNAATSWPKPPVVSEAMTRFINNIGANPGRSGHRLSVDAARSIYHARQAVAGFFNASDPMRVTFGHNITEALNLALRGLLGSGDHVITSSMEHNAVMRPLRWLESQGVALTIVPCSPQGFLDPADIEKAICPETKLIVLNHASNVTGGLLPVSEAGRIARKHGLLLLVDSAQTAGAIPIDMQADNIDLLAFTGHKSLLGPTGTGGLILGERVADDAIQPLILGGTGSRSEEEQQPDFLPDRFESGTANTAGLAGLSASLQWLHERGANNIRQHEVALTTQLIRGLQNIPGVTVYGGGDAELQTATVSFNINHLAPSAVGMRLDAEYGILCRVGLHCAPAAHRTLGTFPDGTLRFGLGVFNNTKEVEQVLQAVTQLASEAA